MITMIMLMLELSSKAVAPVTNSDYMMMTRMLKLSVQSHLKFNRAAIIGRLPYYEPQPYYFHDFSVVPLARWLGGPAAGLRSGRCVMGLPVQVSAERKSLN